MFAPKGQSNIRVSQNAKILLGQNENFFQDLYRRTNQDATLPVGFENSMAGFSQNLQKELENRAIGPNGPLTNYLVVSRLSFLVLQNNRIQISLTELARELQRLPDLQSQITALEAAVAGKDQTTLSGLPWKLFGLVAARGLMLGVTHAFGKPLCNEVESRWHDATKALLLSDRLEHSVSDLTELISRHAHVSELFDSVGAESAVKILRKIVSVFVSANLLTMALQECKLNESLFAKQLELRAGDGLRQGEGLALAKLCRSVSWPLCQIVDRVAAYVPARDRMLLNELTQQGLKISQLTEDLTQIGWAAGYFIELVDSQRQRQQFQEHQYLSATHHNLNQADYFGIPNRNDDSTLSSFPLHIAYISLYATKVTRSSSKLFYGSLDQDIEYSKHYGRPSSTSSCVR